MRRIASSLLLAFFTGFAFAQNWCPPGAQWNYSIQALDMAGYVVRTYAGDTVIGGLAAQRIHESGERVQYWTGDTITIDSDRYTSLQDSILYMWTFTSGTWEWDTLLRFDGLPGDRWFPPGSDLLCSDGYLGMVMVVDTGSTTVDDVPLRTWQLSYCDASGEPMGWSAGDVVERMGSMSGLELLPGGCIIVEYGEVLRCYTDFEISYNDQQWPYGCASVTSMTDLLGVESFEVFPNPGTDHLTLQPVSGSNTITVHDALGRTVLTQRTSSGTVEIDASSFAPGAYTVSSVAANGSRSSTIWMKE